MGAETPRKHVNATASCRETENGSAPGPAQDARRLTQYKELASSLWVARYGSKQDLVARVTGVAGGNTKLMTLIDKAKKSMVLKKEKEKQAKKDGRAAATVHDGRDQRSLVLSPGSTL